MDGRGPSQVLHFCRSKTTKADKQNNRENKTHLLISRRESTKHRHSSLTADSPPHVGAWIEVARQTLALGLRIVYLRDLDHLLLDISERVERDVFDLVLEAVFLQSEAAASEKHICFTCGSQIAYPVANKDNHRNRAVVGLELCICPVLLD